MKTRRKTKIPQYHKKVLFMKLKFYKVYIMLVKFQPDWCPETQKGQNILY